MKRHWYDYLWIASLVYLTLGFFNILFAWLGLICFLLPLGLSIAGAGKVYCHRYCGRGQLFARIGGLGLSRRRNPPRFLSSRWFRYGFLIFFMTMFLLMIGNTYLVFAGARELGEVVTLLWTFRLPWHWAAPGGAIPAWVAQFGYGFYSVMLTSTVLGLAAMIFFKPRTWCVFCPMGTMTQLICRAKSRNLVRLSQTDGEKSAIL